ncbi:hypothetical protein WISP_34837 [Willisornis vidua]|uniref:Uncharacterized protein n=1 Tax=Willisornis vidua TaxID=1566151 RepID=A0ABQ9DPL5_9PASS|nr:hypothetical protein WISP_34837 [Willisornis vidua]
MQTSNDKPAIVLALTKDPGWLAIHCVKVHYEEHKVFLHTHGVMVSTPDSGSQGREFESQWRPYPAVQASLPIRSRQISDAQQGQPRLVPVTVDSPEDFTVTVQARSVVADGPQD